MSSLFDQIESESHKNAFVQLNDIYLIVGESTIGIQNLRASSPHTAIQVYDHCLWNSTPFLNKDLT